MDGWEGEGDGVNEYAAIYARVTWLIRRRLAGGKKKPGRRS